MVRGSGSKGKPLVMGFNPRIEPDFPTIEVLFGGNSRRGVWGKGAGFGPYELPVLFRCAEDDAERAEARRETECLVGRESGRPPGPFFLLLEAFEMEVPL